MFQNRKHHFKMTALGVALAAGAAAVARAFDATEKFVVDGTLKVTHAITEQVCHFDDLAQLENYLANIADPHNWFRHDQVVKGPFEPSAYDPLGREPSTVADLARIASGELAAPMSLAAIVGDTTALDQIDTTASQVAALAPADAAQVDAGPAAVTATEASAPAVEGTVTATDTAAPEAPAA